MSTFPTDNTENLLLLQVNVSADLNFETEGCDRVRVSELKQERTLERERITLR
jgi:hypothetical protein